MAELTEHHRTTLYHLDQHPTSHNLEWKDVLALLREVGDVEERHNGKVKVTVGEQTLILSAPRGKDIDEDLAVLLRHVVREAGYFNDGGAER
ncbi:hypothetical protein [Microbacterium hominis]|uniref:hypothetical protein n=1 Tax=Microbacterium hominis TaxID=162426 RepID=UPI0007687E50|nr:hypothetical protein [Microbacterium hominis]KXC05063.1 hypothetical protein MhomT_13090 [Microbacterium hominis]